MSQNNIKRKLVIIADQHLASMEETVRFCDFIATWEAKTTTLLFLGDIFHVWFDDKRYFYAEHTYFLEKLFAFRNKGGLLYMVAGNKDIFFHKKRKYLPFHQVTKNILLFQHNGKKIMALHGDQINRADKEYLCLRNIGLHHYSFAALLFKIAPQALTHKISRLVQQIANNRKTVKGHTVHFSVKDYLAYLTKLQKKRNADYIFLGHFHMPELYTMQLATCSLYVIPAWLKDKVYAYLEGDQVKTAQYTP